MASSKDLEEKLPLEAPAAAHPIVGPTNRVKCSVYDITPLDPRQQAQLLSDLNSDHLGTQTCRFAADQHRLLSLREAFDNHIHARDEDETVHPYIFIVADQKDGHSVLIVNLKAPTERKDVKFVVGVCRCGTKEADLMSVNLDVGNVDWIDYKESEEGKWGVSSVYANQRYFPSDPRKTKGSEKGDLEERRYAWYSLVRRALPISTMLEPDWVNTGPENSRFTLAGNVNTLDQPFEEIRRLFPYVCWIDSRVERKLLLVATDEKGGMSIYRALWDAESEFATYPFEPGVDLRDQPHIRGVKTIMPELEYVEQTRASEALGRLQRL